MRTPCTVGVIGVGTRGLPLARGFDGLAQTELRWLCDRDAGRRLLLGRPFGSVAWASEPRELFGDEDLDAVVVATPAHSHRALVRDALLAGKHVLVTNPLGTVPVDVEELAALARDQERHLLVANELLFAGVVAYVKNLVDTSALGQILYARASSRTRVAIYGDENVLWCLAPDDLAALLYLLGDEPTRVEAHGDAYVRPGVPDIAFCHLAFATGIGVHLDLSRLDPRPVRRLTLVGTERTATIDLTRGRERLVLREQRPALRSLAPIGPPLQGDVLTPGIGGEDPVALQCRAFADVLQLRPQPDGVGRLTDAVVAVLAALQRSLEQGGESVQLTTPAGDNLVPLPRSARGEEPTTG